MTAYSSTVVKLIVWMAVAASESTLACDRGYSPVTAQQSIICARRTQSRGTGGLFSVGKWYQPFTF